MSNNNDRDKMLEEILKSVDNDAEPDTGKSRAERAAASSANRAAYERHNATSSFNRVLSPSGRSSGSAYSKASNAAKNNNSISNRTENLRRTSDGWTSGVSRTGMTDRSELNGRTGAMSRTGMLDNTGDIPFNSSADEFSGSLNRLIDTFDNATSGSDSKTSKMRRAAHTDRKPQASKTAAMRTVRTPAGERKVRERTSDMHDPEKRMHFSGVAVRKGGGRFSGRVPIVLIITTVIFTVAISLSILIISVGRDMLAIGKSDNIKIITIPEGANTEEVAQILYDEQIIKMPKAFIFISKLGDSDTKYIAGEHELSPSYAYETIINELTTDRSLEKETVDITFVEGCNLISAAKQLEEANVCEAERFLYYFNAGDYGFEFENYLPASTASKFNRMEGYLFPDTYTFYVETDPEVVCQKIYKNFDEKFKEEYYKKMTEMNMTLDEVITLASIVQAESPDVPTMKKVASVFENRLASPEEYPKLQSDPTTYYVEEIIKPNIDIPSEAIFEAYDTYTCIGLPPGAIGNPGTDAIEAVLYPAKTNYYFFYADIDTMETFFAETDEEHEKNKDMVNGVQSDGEDDEYDDEGYDDDYDDYYE